MENGIPEKPKQQVLGPETNAVVSKVRNRHKKHTKKTFLRGLEDATRVLYKENYLKSEDVHRLAMGAFVKVLTDKDHVNWRFAMKEYMDRIYGKVSDKIEHSIDRQLLEEIRLYPVRGKIAELPLLDEEKKGALPGVGGGSEQGEGHQVGGEPSSMPPGAAEVADGT